MNTRACAIGSRGLSLRPCYWRHCVRCYGPKRVQSALHCLASPLFVILLSRNLRSHCKTCLLAGFWDLSWLNRSSSCFKSTKNWIVAGLRTRKDVKLLTKIRQNAAWGVSGDLLGPHLALGKPQDPQQVVFWLPEVARTSSLVMFSEVHLLKTSLMMRFYWFEEVSKSVNTA